jgi:SAM-dependent methyltransferase
MAAQGQALDEAKLGAFMEKVVGDFSGTMATLLSAMGDKLGLWKELAEGGPATSSELAARAGIDERYAREWLHGMFCAGYLEHDDASERFVLPPEHVPAFAQERGPMFMCGGYQELLGVLGTVPQLVESFKTGGGVPQSAYAQDFWDGLTRFTGAWFENQLVQDWIPALPEVEAKLKAGARWADVGCGGGLALVQLAQAFPASTFVGYDAFDGMLADARAAAEAAGVADRVRFEQRDVVQGLAETYDVISTFDVVHDAVDPVGLLRGIRSGLADDGHYLMLEINCADRPLDNAGPLGTLFYGFSVTYCMTTSLAQGGAGLGTCGIPPAKAKELCAEAGFARTDQVPLDNPFNILYDVRVT